MDTPGKFLLLMLIVLLTSCQKSEKDIQIGFLIHSLSSSRWQMDTELIRKRAEERGVKITIKNAEGDENIQLGQVNELLAEDIDVIIVVAANQNTAAGIIRSAHKQNVPVIAYDRMIRNSDVDYLVSFQYDMVGQLMIDYAIRKRPSGNYVILWGDPSDGNAQAVQSAQIRAIDPYLKNGQINLMYKTFIDGWSKENAFFFMKQIIEFSQSGIDAVICSNDPMAAGAFDALSQYGYQPRQVLITGQDATLEGCRSILSGQQTMTIYKSIQELASQAVDLAIDVAARRHKIQTTGTVNNGRKDVPAILLPPTIVDEENILSTVVADSVFSMDDLLLKK